MPTAHNYLIAPRIPPGRVIDNKLVACDSFVWLVVCGGWVYLQMPLQQIFAFMRKSVANAFATVRGIPRGALKGSLRGPRRGPRGALLQEGSLEALQLLSHVKRNNAIPEKKCLW